MSSQSIELHVLSAASPGASFNCRLPLRRFPSYAPLCLCAQYLAKVAATTTTPAVATKSELEEELARLRLENERLRKELSALKAKAAVGPAAQHAQSSGFISPSRMLRTGICLRCHLFSQAPAADVKISEAAAVDASVIAPARPNLKDLNSLVGMPPGDLKDLLAQVGLLWPCCQNNASLTAWLSMWQ